MVDMLKFESGILQACQMAATTRSHYGKFTPKSTQKYAEFLLLILKHLLQGWTNAKKTIIFDNYSMTVWSNTSLKTNVIMKLSRILSIQFCLYFSCILRITKSQITGGLLFTQFLLIRISATQCFATSHRICIYK